MLIKDKYIIIVYLYTVVMYTSRVFKTYLTYNNFTYAKNIQYLKHFTTVIKLKLDWDRI